VAEIQKAERDVSSRREPMLIAFEQRGRIEFCHSDAIIAADVLGLNLTFKRLHSFRSERRRKPMRRGFYAIPFLALPSAEYTKELTALSGYPVRVIGPCLPVATPKRGSKVADIGFGRRMLEASRRACA
jgi:hypothetical protein